MNRYLAIILGLAALAFGSWLYGVVAERAAFQRQAEMLYREGRTLNATIATLNKAKETTDSILPVWRLELDANSAWREEKRQNTKTAGGMDDFAEWATGRLPAAVHAGGSAAGRLLGSRAATAREAAGAAPPGSFDAANPRAPVAGQE